MIPSGGLSLEHQRWVHPRYPFFLPVVVLRRVFRGKFVDGLKDAFHQGKLVFPGSLRPLAAEKAFAAFLRPLFRKEWVVYSKRPFGGPEYVLHYLARYPHRVAISNHRLLSLADGNVTGFAFDVSHSYTLPILLSAGANIVAAVIVAATSSVAAAGKTALQR